MQWLSYQKVQKGYSSWYQNNTEGYSFWNQQVTTSVAKFEVKSY